MKSAFPLSDTMRLREVALKYRSMACPWRDRFRGNSLVVGVAMFHQSAGADASAKIQLNTAPRRGSSQAMITSMVDAGLYATTSGGYSTTVGESATHLEICAEG